MDVVIRFCHHCFQHFKGHCKLALAFSNSSFCSRSVCNAKKIFLWFAELTVIISVYLFWDVTAYGPAVSTNVLEERIALIFRVEKKMEAAVSSDLLVSIYKTTRCYIADGRYLSIPRRENFISQRLAASISLIVWFLWWEVRCVFVDVWTKFLNMIQINLKSVARDTNSFRNFFLIYSEGACCFYPCQRPVYMSIHLPRFKYKHQYCTH
jgi:hypothetical protein